MHMCGQTRFSRYKSYISPFVQYPRMIQEVRDMEIKGKQSNDVIEPFIVYHHVTNAFTSIESNSRFRSRGSVGVIELNSMSQDSIHSFIYFIHSLLLHSFVLLSSQSFIFILFSSIT